MSTYAHTAEPQLVPSPTNRPNNNAIRFAKTASWNSIGICITTFLVGMSSGQYFSTFMMALPTVAGLAAIYFGYDFLWDGLRKHGALSATALVARGLCWRIIVSFAIGMLAYFFHGSLATVTVVAAIHAILNTMLEILHEKVWDEIRARAAQAL